MHLQPALSTVQQHWRDNRVASHLLVLLLHRRAGESQVVEITILHCVNLAYCVCVPACMCMNLPECVFASE